MDAYVENLRAGLRLACGLPVDLARFRASSAQVVGLALTVFMMVALFRLFAAPGPKVELPAGPGSILMLAVGAVGCIWLVDRIRKAKLSLASLLVLVLSSEIAVLMIAATARQVVIRFPSAVAAHALAFLPWVVLGWMVLIVIRAASMLASARA